MSIRGGVRRIERRGEEYLVAPISFLKAMELDKGYVPRAHVKKSTPEWHGVPITRDHAKQDGKYVSANNEMFRWVGYIMNPQWDGSLLGGEAWLSVNGAPDVVTSVENGDDVSVSAAYGGDSLDPGVYDGAYRDEVKGNLEPDHVALVDKGVCSVQDGCKIG